MFHSHRRKSGSRTFTTQFVNTFEKLEGRSLLAASIEQIEFDHDHGHEVPAWFPREQTLVSTSLTQTGTYLTAAQRGRKVDLAVNFLQSRSRELNLAQADIASPYITDAYATQDTGVSHVYLRQEYNNLPVINAAANINLMSDGRILSANSGFVKAVAETNRVVPTNDVVWALRQVTDEVEVRPNVAIKVVGRMGGLNQRVQLSAPEMSTDPINAQLVYVASPDGRMELSWHLQLNMPGGYHWYEMAISTSTGQVTFVTDYVHNAVYNAYARNIESPYDGVRTLQNDPWTLADASINPFGWHDTNNVAGAESTLTIGNNVDAYLDRDNNNAPDATNGRPDGGASLTFNHALDLTAAPTTVSNQNAAVTNLFVANNYIHDITAKYGFNEVAGNFQVNNFGRGGLGNDSVQAEAQDGGGTNNANFATPPDGQRPRMQMYLWTSSSPQRDGDLDQQIVYHEFGHGVSNRLTGGPSNSSALSALQSGGMGEGWSDYLAILLTMKATDTRTTNVAMSPYALGQPPSGVGIRSFYYTTDMAVNPMTIGLFNSNSAVHYAGTIWASTLWDMTWNLVDAHGFDADLNTGYSAGGAGNKLALKLVLDGMKLQPVTPTFGQARDAILQADVALTGGANQGRIWQAFARRGLGNGFSTASSNSSSVVQSFSIPSADPVVQTEAILNTIASPSSVELLFNEPMQASSFSVAQDVGLFTGPGGVNLIPTISGFSWTAANRLKIDFATAAAEGAYTIRVGPNILAADNSAPMDQNLNGVTGEAGDTFTLTVNYSPYLGPDASGYRAGPMLFENINLTVGSPGVTEILTSSDDASATIPLGSNSFNFYGTNYTSVGVNTNGLITFGAAITDYVNTDLTSSPTLPSVAVMWDDWTTGTNSSDSIKYALQDSDGVGGVDRLVVEWDVYRLGSTASIVTYHSILRLNTGAALGGITLNYVDLDSGSAESSNGAGSSVGIKANGLQGTSRLLVSRDTASSPFIGDGKAIRIAQDVVAPRLVSSAFDRETSQTVRLGFSENVQATLATTDITLVNTTTGATIPSAGYTLSYNAVNNTASLLMNSIIPNGRYRVTVAGNTVTDVAGMPLDGDANGVPGGNAVYNFTVLAGDATGNGTVDFNDLVILASNYGQSGKTFSQGNFNYSAGGLVDFNDLVLLASSYNVTLFNSGSPIDGSTRDDRIAASVFA